MNLHAAGKKLRKIGLSSSPPPGLSKDTPSISGGDQILFCDLTLGCSYPYGQSKTRDCTCTGAGSRSADLPPSPAYVMAVAVAKGRAPSCRSNHAADRPAMFVRAAGDLLA
ncbi:hypothetical protein C2845_PM17G01620 [Panicum miliaceum]|uniref:Uncharacterized protein n=1 Tax=Panicum miliaceum TaxID=4540 RepID=A0A3L6Q1M8_PANMI|nr:hypothetical protein C2845_PM17G01620 [Panicum miliaceum]